MEHEELAATAPLPLYRSRSFAGHFMNGFFYLIIGCLWTYNTLFRYYVARRQMLLKGKDAKKLSYKNSLFSKYHSNCAQAIPVEGIVLAAGSTFACFAEIFLYHEDLPLIEAVHHVIIFTMIAILGIIEILRHYRFSMPPSSEYAMFIILMTLTGFLLQNHLISKQLVDRQLHVILVYFNITIILFTAIELMYKKNVTAALGRTAALMAQGVWMCVIGIIAYPLPFMPVYDLTNHTLLHIVTTLSAVAIAIALTVVCTMNVITSRRVKSMNLSTVNRIVALTHYQRFPSGSKNEAECPLISDSDYEI